MSRTPGWPHSSIFLTPQLSSLVQIGKTGRTPLSPPLRPPRSLACGEAAPPLPESAKEVAWVTMNTPCGRMHTTYYGSVGTMRLHGCGARWRPYSFYFGGRTSSGYVVLPSSEPYSLDLTLTPG